MVYVFLALQAFGQGDPIVSDEPKLETRVRLWHNLSEAEILDADEIAGWSLAVPKFLNLAADKLIVGERPEDQGVPCRLAKLVFFGAPLGLANGIISGASHEYGHFRAYSRAGFRDFEFFRDVDGDILDGNPLTALWVMVNQNVLGREPYSASFGDFDPALIAGREKEFNLLLEAGGFNQVQYNAEILSAELHDEPAHFLDALPYFSNLLGTMFYPNGSTAESSDIGDARDGLRQLGVEASTGDIRWRSQLPKLAGNAAISFFLAVADYVVTGDVVAEPLKLDFGEHRIYWPEFSSYLTLDGPTVKVAEWLGWRDNLCALSYERSLATGAAELGIAHRWRIQDGLGVDTKFVHALEGGGWWLEGGPAVRVSDWLTVGFKAYCGEGRTFYREIAGLEPDFLEDSEGGVKVFVEFTF